MLKVGVLGAGHLGKIHLKLLNQSSHYELIGFYDPNENYARQVSKEELFDKTQVLSLHTPQTDLTEKMVNQAFINKFKNNIYLINTARGSAAVIKDLVMALAKGKVLGACLDVLEYEKTSFEDFFSNKNTLPVEFQQLISSDKVLLSPHVAGWTIESKYKLAETIVHKVAAMLDQHNSIK